MRRNIILASASPRRRELLAQIGLEFRVRPAAGEEKTDEQEPGKRVEALSCHKAVQIAEEADEDTVIIGADTLVFCQGRTLGKPKDEEDARAMLSLLAGNTHQVYTGVTLAWKEDGAVRRRSFFEKTDVSVYPMTPEEISDYIGTGEPMDKAGAYGIQGRFARYIRGISGDYTNVVGLPAGRVYQELKGILE